MQDQNTSGATAGQAAVPGRFVFTAILHGAADAVDNAFRAIMALLPAHDVALVQAGTQGPLPASDERSRLPVIPGFQPPASGIVEEIGTKVAEVVDAVVTAEPAVAAEIATAEQVIGSIAPQLTDSKIGKAVEAGIAEAEGLVPSVDPVAAAIHNASVAMDALESTIMGLEPEARSFVIGLLHSFESPRPLRLPRPATPPAPAEPPAVATPPAPLPAPEADTRTR